MFLLGFIRVDRDMEILEDFWYIAFSIVTLVTINCGCMVLCFRRKKYVCIFALSELLHLILYAGQMYIFINDNIKVT